MKSYRYPKKREWQEILERPAANYSEIEKTVEEVFSEVKQTGDVAVKKYAQKFGDAVPEDLKVSPDELKAAESRVPEDLKEAIRLAYSNIKKFHAAQQKDRISVETLPGVECWQEARPIEKVGLYIPGGSAPLFSTVLMLAIPANLAGCKEIILCTPPRSGKIDPVILFAAHLCGVTNVYKIGGIQAIAAMTFGTKSVPKIYKIFGPGNQFVTVAKQVATKYNVVIDMPAGPSELLVVADDTANPAFVAADLLSQAEHGSDSQVIMVSLSKGLVEKVQEEIKNQLEVLPRKNIATAALEYSKFIFMSKKEEALELINNYAPEHFIVSTNNWEFFSEGIVNAGSVFIGNNTPESAGDYASGTNHTLPTNGFAKQHSGLNLSSFTKTVTFQKITEAGIKSIGPSIELMAEAEGLQAHKNAVTLRLKELQKEENE